MQLTELTHNANDRQFFLFADEHKAFIDYTIEDGQYQLNHSEVPQALRGQGVGRVLVEKTFEAIEKEGKTAVAHCSYIRHIAKQSSRWDGIISTRQ